MLYRSLIKKVCGLCICITCKSNIVNESEKVAFKWQNTKLHVCIIFQLRPLPSVGRFADCDGSYAICNEILGARLSEALVCSVYSRCNVCHVFQCCVYDVCDVMCMSYVSVMANDCYSMLDHHSDVCVLGLVDNPCVCAFSQFCSVHAANLMITCMSLWTMMFSLAIQTSSNGGRI